MQGSGSWLGGGAVGAVGSWVWQSWLQAAGSRGLHELCVGTRCGGLAPAMRPITAMVASLPAQKQRQQHAWTSNSRSCVLTHKDFVALPIAVVQVDELWVEEEQQGC